MLCGLWNGSLHVKDMMNRLAEGSRKFLSHRQLGKQLKLQIYYNLLFTCKVVEILCSFVKFKCGGNLL